MEIDDEPETIDCSLPTPQKTPCPALGVVGPSKRRNEFDGDDSIRASAEESGFETFETTTTNGGQKRQKVKCSEAGEIEVSDE